MKKRSKVLVTSLLMPVLCVGMAVAQENKRHEAAARKLYRTFWNDKANEANIEVMMVRIRSNPKLAPYEDLVRPWFRKVLADPEFETEMVRLYGETFSEQELRALASFYQSPTGQKALTALPAMMARGTECAGQISKQHQAELEKLIAERQKELHDQETPKK